MDDPYLLYGFHAAPAGAAGKQQLKELKDRVTQLVKNNQVESGMPDVFTVQLKPQGAMKIWVELALLFQTTDEGFDGTFSYFVHLADTRGAAYASN
jgi:hypothetical protein